MAEKKISVRNLLLDISNYRILPQASQKEALNAIIEEQGEKLAVLAKDILDNGMNPSDLPCVIPADDQGKHYIVVEGNRRLAAVRLLNEPELAKGTSIHTKFVQLSNFKSDAIPTIFNCVEMPDRTSAQVWINRKHANDMRGAGTEHWSPLAKMRAQKAEGVPQPVLEVIDLVLSDDTLDATLRATLTSGDFSATNLERLVTTEELQRAFHFTLVKGALSATSDRLKLRAGFVEVLKLITATGFTVDQIRHTKDRQKFILKLPKLTASIKGRGKPIAPSKTPPTAKTSRKPKGKTPQATQSIARQTTLIPQDFSLKLPVGKINDVFAELKTLHVVEYRHAASILVRVFLEFSLDEYIREHQIQPPAKGDEMTLSWKLDQALARAKNQNQLNTEQIKAVNVLRCTKDAILSPDTLNKYVHSRWMNPDPESLKSAWINLQPFIAHLWAHQ